MPFRALVDIGALTALVGLSSAAGVKVDSIPSLQKAIEAASPGEHIVLADGQYMTDSPIRVAVATTAERPIEISAESVGGVEILGKSGLRLHSPAAYVVIQRFTFAHKAGEMALAPGAHRCRVTRNIFELSVPGRARYHSISGNDNEIDHNGFRNKNKNTEGQMVQVLGPEVQTMAQRTWIHHDYLHDFMNSRRNNSSALHIDNSRRMSSAYTVVEHNLFLRTTGGNEGTICNKASDNTYRYNTFGERSSEWSLQHGERCLVRGNCSVGGHGVRFFEQDHRIYNNYFENCRPAITIGNGAATIPPSRLTSHERPDRVQVVYSTILDNRTNVRMNRRRDGAQQRVDSAN